MEDERRIERVLSREPRPELSPFFSARVTNELKRREVRPRPVPLVLRIYWLAMLVGTVLIMHSMALGFDLTVISLTLVPVGFGIWAYRGDVAAILLRLGAVLFGSR